MSLSQKRRTLGREPFQLVRFWLDYCPHVSGEAPCTATQTGDAKCYNTRYTCNDVPNYGTGTKLYSFCSMTQQVPVNLAREKTIPAIRSVSHTPAKIDPANGLGLRASVTVTLADFPHDDRSTDKYVGERSYIPLNRGTFFGKLRARNPYYQGRLLQVLTGYLNDDGTLDEENTETRTYFIESFSGPDANGNFRIEAKDILKLADDERAQAPAPSVGKLFADITDVATTLTLTPAGIGNAKYPALGIARIGSEVVRFTRVNDTVTLTERGVGFTAAAEHGADETFQLCLELQGTCQNILYTLLVDYCGVDPVYIPKAEWDAEQLNYLPRLYYSLITAPTGARKLIVELCTQMGFYIWWDEVAQLIKFRAIRPIENDEVTQLGPDFHILENSVGVKDLVDKRINEVWVYHGIIDYTKSLEEESNYRIIHVEADLEAQELYGDVRVKKVFSRWITKENAVAAVDLAQKVLSRYKRTPRQVNFALDAKDAAVDLSDFVTLTSRQVQDPSGDVQQLNLQVVERTEPQVGTTFRYVAQEFDFIEFVPSTQREIIIAADTFGVNLRQLHDSIYSPPVGGETITCRIRSGVKVGGKGRNFLHNVNLARVAPGIMNQFVPIGDYAIVQFPDTSGLKDPTVLYDVVTFFGMYLLGTAYSPSLSEAELASKVFWSTRAIVRYAATSFKTGDWPPGCTLKLIIEPGAYIYGEGGNGGLGFIGGSGGNALGASYPITVDNQGSLIGGGAGGNGILRVVDNHGYILGGDFDSSLFGTNTIVAIGGGGGAGYGVSTDTFDAEGVVGGQGGRVSNNYWYATFTQYRTGLNRRAERGTLLAGGLPGKLTSGGRYGTASSAEGDAGRAAGVAIDTPGGVPGAAVVGNAFITWLNTGTRIGGIIT